MEEKNDKWNDVEAEKDLKRLKIEDTYWKMEWERAHAQARTHTCIHTNTFAETQTFTEREREREEERFIRYESSRQNLFFIVRVSSDKPAHSDVPPNCVPRLTMVSLLVYSGAEILSNIFTQLTLSLRGPNIPSMCWWHDENPHE